MSELKELRKLAEAATPGPWSIEEDEDSGAGAVFIVSGIEPYCGPYITRMSGHHDSEFIAAANPAAVIELLDTIESQQAQITQLKEQVEAANVSLKAARKESFDNFVAYGQEAKANNELRAQLAQQPASAVPDGWKLVPIEPTKEQLFDAAFNLSAQFGFELVQENENFARAVYRELLAASPTAQAEKECGDD